LTNPINLRFVGRVPQALFLDRPRPGRPTLLAFLVSKFLSKFPGHEKLGSAKNEKGQPHRDKKPISAVVSKEVQTEPDEGQSQNH
jgi:hypothetical protein